MRYHFNVISKVTVTLIQKEVLMMANYQFLNAYKFRSGVTLKNRIVIPPMTETMSFYDGNVTQDEIDYFRIHTGGAGLFITPVANVNALGKGFEGELSAAADQFIPSLSRVAHAIHQNGTKAVLQIFSAGRMSNSQVLRGHQPVSASAIPAVRPGAETPRALTGEEVEQTIADFGSAVQRAIQAGFDGVELHGANTYLLQQFFSPHSNRRDDRWGGSLEKRMAFPLAVIQLAKQVIQKYAVKPFLLGYRLSPEEIEEPGIRIEDTLAFVKVLRQQQLDYLHVSMGNAWRTSLNDKSDSEPLIKKIQAAAGADLPLISVGNLRTPAEVEKVMATGIPLAALGQESLAEPHWVQKVMAGAEDQIRYQISAADAPDLGIQLPFWNFLTNLTGSKDKVGSNRKQDAKHLDKLFS